MLGSSSGVPYSHQATASSPSKTSAACARPSSTNRCLSARLSSASYVFSEGNVWNHVHQQPPNTPLCRSVSRANASHVSGVKGLTTYSLMHPSFPPPGNRVAELLSHAQSRCSGPVAQDTLSHRGTSGCRQDDA